MKEHFALAEQKLDGHLYYVWSPPWPAKLIGFRFSCPVRIHEIVIGLSTIATDNHELCQKYPEYRLQEAPSYDIAGLRMDRERVIAVGQSVTLLLAQHPRWPGMVELLIEPLEKPEVRIVSRTAYEAYTRGPTEAECAEKRVTKRKRQVAECLATLRLPVEGKRYR